MVTVPQEVGRYLDAVTARVRDVFGDRAPGVYTTGSLAPDDYRPGRSDIDRAFLREVLRRLQSQLSKSS
jgi:hypothetical protein